MSAPGNLQRSSWKVEAIRRGTLKISKPIPIDEDTPLTTEAEEQDLANKSSPDQVVQDPSLHHAISTDDAVSDQPALRQDTTDMPSSRSPPGARPVDDMYRDSVVPQSPTPFRETPESTSTAAMKRKRKSGLRNVFRKMFGRKDRDELPEVNEEPARRGHSYHHSDPGLLRQQSPPRDTASKTPSGPRISDLPVEELQPLHPLGQHLPFPMNVNAPQTSSPQEYLTFDHSRPDVGRRRATLPNFPGTTSQRHSLDEPRARLSSWEERNEDDALPSPGIGIALSSPQQSTLREKRRSRSAGALRELASARQSVEKSRSEEIRYWQESYASASIYSSHTRPQTAKTEENMRSGLAQEPTLLQAEPAQEMSAIFVQPGDVTPLQAESPRAEPPTPFNFDLATDAPEIAASIEPHDPPMAELSESRASMENRVRHLEDNVHTLEASIRRISTHNSHQTIILEHAPKSLRSRTRSSSRSASASAVSVHQASAPTSNASASNVYAGPPSPPLVPTDPRLPADLRAVYEALAHERAARKALETRVATLTSGIADLRALVGKLVALNNDKDAYPTPSPDSIAPHSRSEDHDATPRAAPYGVYSKSNGNDVDAATPYDDGITPDAWATPKEVSGFESGFFNGRRE